MPTVKVPSDRDPSLTYFVDVVAGTCTCLSSARLQAQGGKEVCKHVQRVRLSGAPAEAEEAPAPPSDVALALAHPDPEPEDLPYTIPAESLASLDIAIRVLRAVKKSEVAVAELTKRRNADLRAWDEQIAREEQRAKGWKDGVLAWMQSHRIEKIPTPWWTAFPRKGGNKLVLDDEEKAKAKIKELKYAPALETVDQIVWKEFTILFDSDPKAFAEVKAEDGSLIRPAIAHRESNPDILVIQARKRKE